MNIDNIDDDACWSVREAAAICGTTQTNIRLNISRGNLKADGERGRVYIKGSDLKAWYNSHKWRKWHGIAEEAEPVPGYKHDCRFFAQPGEGVVVCTALTEFYNGKTAAEKCRGCCFYKARKGVVEGI